MVAALSEFHRMNDANDAVGKTLFGRVEGGIEFKFLIRNLKTSDLRQFEISDFRFSKCGVILVLRLDSRDIDTINRGPVNGLRTKGSPFGVFCIFYANHSMLLDGRAKVRLKFEVPLQSCHDPIILVHRNYDRMSAAVQFTRTPWISRI
jgi:hypothetical protein